MSPQVDESPVLAGALADVLRAEGVPAPDLVPAAEPLVTARSTLYRLTDRSTGSTYVVKRAVVADGWVDTEAALPTEAQYEALERAYRWQAEEDRHAVVRPVGLFPEHDAFAMTWAPGRTLKEVLRRAVVDPSAARTAVAAAGDFLRRFHAHGRSADVELDLGASVQDVLDFAAGPLREAGLRLPDRVVATLEQSRGRSVVAPHALLHGDYVPSNLLLQESGEVVMLDPLLARVGPTVDDLARFLTVMSSETVFLPGEVLPPVRRIRRQLEATFLSAYGISGGGALLELRLLKQHLLRWLARREHSEVRGVPLLFLVRRVINDVHMRTLLRESAARLARATSDGPVLPDGP